jgi:HlyD family secretion protein
MDREIAPRVRRRKLVVRIAAGIGALLLGAAFILSLSDWLRPSLSTDELRTGYVDRGAVRETVQASGTVQPAVERAVSSPVEARVLRIHKQAGDPVKAGDEILELDTSQTVLAIARLEERIGRKRSELEESRLKGASDRAEMESRIESAALDLELAQAHEARCRKLHREGLLSGETLAEAEVKARKAALETGRLRGALDNQLRTAQAVLDRIEMEIEVGVKELAMERDRLELASARAREDGVLVWVLPREGVTVARGEVLARIARLDRFHIDAKASDIHASRLRRGAPAEVEAAGTVLAGSVGAIRPAVEGGTVLFTVELDEPSHSLLRQSLRVDIHVEADVRRDVLRIPRVPFTRGGKVQDVFVVEGDRARRRSVRVGLTGRHHMEIEEGLAEGEEVVLNDLRERMHLEEILID